MPLATALAGSWNPSPGVLIAAAAALGLFAQAFRRLRGRGRTDHAPWSRAVVFGLGVAAVTLALVSPLDAIGEEQLLSAHMLQHAALLDIGPGLVLVAVRGPLVFFLLPPEVLGPLGRFRPLRALARFLLRPSVAFVAWLAAVAAWHVPAAYDYALRHTWAHDLEHASLVLVGLLAWAQLVDPARRGALGIPGRACFALGLFVAAHTVLHPALLGGHVLYAPYRSVTGRPLGLSPLADQHLAAWLMTVEAAVVFGAFLLLLFRAERSPRLSTVAVPSSTGRR
jgi:cytochrome c oxidase assembly factor CtaG